VGVVAGWLAGQIVSGGGFGLIGDLIVGVIGAFSGDWLARRLGIHLGVGTAALIINPTIGAIALLLIIRLVAGRPDAQSSQGRRPQSRTPCMRSSLWTNRFISISEANHPES